MNLLEKIKNKQALIGIIGMGYVGLPLVLRFCEVGFRVLGFDTDANKVERLNRGESYIKHIPRLPAGGFATPGRGRGSLPPPRHGPSGGTGCLDHLRAHPSDL